MARSVHSLDFVTHLQSLSFRILPLPFLLSSLSPDSIDLNRRNHSRSTRWIEYRLKSLWRIHCLLSRFLVLWCSLFLHSFSHSLFSCTLRYSILPITRFLSLTFYQLCSLLGPMHGSIMGERKRRTQMKDVWLRNASAPSSSGSCSINLFEPLFREEFPTSLVIPFFFVASNRDWEGELSFPFSSSHRASDPSFSFPFRSPNPILRSRFISMERSLDLSKTSSLQESYRRDSDDSVRGEFDPRQPLFGFSDLPNAFHFP